MIDPKEWMTTLTNRLLEAFPGRILFIGLQGSYRRGEADDDSDIDAVVILDRLDLGDMRRYRGILAELPEAEKACGFVSGRDELRHWPRLELFQFRADTDAYHGDLDSLLPPVDDDDIRSAVNLAASGIYHGLCHMYIHADAASFAAGLRGLYKASYFALLAKHYLASGKYARTKRELAATLGGRDGEILALIMDWDGRFDPGNPDAALALMLEWCGDILGKGEYDVG